MQALISVTFAQYTYTYNHIHCIHLVHTPHTLYIIYTYTYTALTRINDPCSQYSTCFSNNSLVFVIQYCHNMFSKLLHTGRPGLCMCSIV